MKTIAADLAISRSRVIQLWQMIRDKLGCESREAVIVWAAKKGLV